VFVFLGSVGLVYFLLCIERGRGGGGGGGA